VVLAMTAGAVTGAFAGVGGKDLLFAARHLAWLPIVPLLVVNVVETERHLRGALAFGAALALVKALLGVVGVAAGVGLVVDGATITYYEPTANWLVLLAILGVVAALQLRVRLPAWVLAGTPLLVLSLALSFRRSFWIGAVLGLLLVVLLGSRPVGRRLAIVAVLALAVAVWTVSRQPLQTEAPIVERARSLEPSKVESNAQDRYRIDELRNVTAEIRREPITGVGLGGQWTATHPLGVDHEDGRGYTHVVALWWWLKLGILGLVAYLAVMASCLAMSWQVWRRGVDPLISAAGLAFFCGLLGLAVVETVGSFTGVDPRFTALLGAVGGLLAVMRRVALRPA
jgi:O-antigen ligase